MSALTLTDAIARPSGQFPTAPSINKRHVFLVYQIGPTNTNDIVAEMFKIEHGKLISTAVLNADIIQPNNPFSVDIGYANNAFNRFTVIDDNQGGPDANPIGRLRVRVFDKNLNLLLSRFDIEFAVGIPQTTFSVIGGSFSDDDKYIQLTYLINATPNAQKSRLHILNASDLSDFAIIDFDGSSYGAIFFSENGRNYLALPQQNGTLEVGFNTPMNNTVSTLQIYRLKKDLKFITSTPLPQIININGLTVGYDECGVLIGASTRRAIDGPSIFVDNSQNQALIDDDREQRVYRYCDCRLKLKSARKTGLTTYGPVFAQCLRLVNTQGLDGELSISTVDGHQLPSPPITNAVFSSDRKWLVLAGSDQNPELRNILLYRL